MDSNDYVSLSTLFRNEIASSVWTQKDGGVFKAALSVYISHV